MNLNSPFPSVNFSSRKIRSLSSWTVIESGTSERVSDLPARSLKKSVLRIFGSLAGPVWVEIVAPLGIRWRVFVYWIVR